MRIKIISIIILTFVNLNSWAVVVAEDEAASTSTRSAITTAAAVNAATIANMEAQQAIANSQAISRNIQISSNIIPSGVIICDAHHFTNNDNDYNYDGCFARGNNGYYSIQKYFDKNKPTQNSKITLVIFDRENKEFQIYYQDQ